jgi:hypothetical protein
MSNIRDAPAPDPAIFTTRSGSSPAALASTIASAAATLWIATSRFATSFIRVPLPNAPISCAARAKSPNSGICAAMAAVSPLA